MTKTPDPRDRWIVCADYVSGPFTEDRAGRELDAIVALGAKSVNGCRQLHAVVTAADRPARAVVAGPLPGIPGAVTCGSCSAQVDPLAVFPGPLCLDCYAKTPEANRPVTAEELAAMWGAPVRRRRA